MTDTNRLTQIAQLARAVVSELDLETVLSRVSTALHSLRPDVVSGIRLVDPDAGGYRLAGTGGSPGARRMPVVVPLGKGLAHIVAETRRPLLVANNATDPRAFGEEWSQASGLTTYYGVPIEAAGELLGVVSMNFPVNEPPTEDERASIDVLAAHVAVAIHNARLFRELDERRRAAEALANVGRVLAETLDETVVANRIVESVLPLFNTHSAILRRLRPDGALVALAISGRARDHFEPGHVMPPGVGLSGRAVAEGRPITGDMLDASGITLTDDYLHRIERAGIRGAVAIPFRVRGEMLGVLALGDSEPRRFSAAEIALLETFADQAALALHNAQLLQQSKARGTQLEALLETTQELSAIEPLEALLEKIAATCGRLLGSGSVGFRLLQGDELVRAEGSFGDAAQMMRKPRLKIGESLSGLVAATGEPLIVADITKDPRMLEEHRAAAVQSGYLQWLGVPAKIGGRLVGVFSVRTRRAEGFSESDVAIATAFAAQAAIALETARLYSDADRRRRTAERLAEVGRLISQSLDLQDVARRVVTNLRSLVPALRAALYRTEPTSDALSLVADAMDPGISITGNRGFARGEGVPGLALLERRLVVTPNLLTDPRIRLSPETHAYWANTPVRAVVAVPLCGSDSILGVLSMADREGRIFTDEELRTLEMFADQASIAVGNARLYQQARDAYRELSDTQAQLLRAGKLAAVGQLVGGVAHELNNPLAIVIGQAHLLKRESSEAQVVRIEKILRGAERAARIVRELRTFARPQPALLATVQLTDVLEHVLALREETLRVSGISLDQDIAPGLPPVWGDEQQLEQVVLNLLLNAEQALSGSRGHPRIMLRLTAGHGRVRLTVSDTGSGIVPEILPRIFDPFFTTKPVGQGTGLGLSISYGIVEAHRGRIWAESTPGQGATFVVELPAYTAEPARAAAPPAAPPPSDLRRGHVLIVDDDADVADTLRGLFESLGQEVTVAIGGEKGWEQLSAPGAQYDLVTIDLKMPDLSGPHLWGRLVGAGSHLAERVVFVTGDTVDGDTRRFLKEAGRPVVSKPFGASDLAEVLRIESSV